jgi:aryl-phospho-beta-D-glucosidase BglC (GH1 family)
MKVRKLVLLPMLCLTTLLAACGGEPSGGAAATAAPTASSAVSSNGRLRVCGTKICNQAGSPVQLRGVSLYWSNTGWGGERFYNATAVSNLASVWGATVVRAAVGVEGQGGYIESAASAQANLNRATAVIDAAIASGVYVIVDWHSVSNVSRQSQAQAFFQQLATRYASSPNLIWEPFNEPTTVSWGSLKTYHQAVIGTIRTAGSQNLVVAGTPTWSQDVDVAANDKLSDSNTAYTLHFYAGTHGQSLRDKAVLAMSRGAALFVTEWGTCDASGNGSYNPGESTNWTNWMDSYSISSANWAFNDKAETASVLVSGGGASATGPWPDAQLTQSGLFVKAYLAKSVGGPTYGLTVTNVSQNGGAGTVADSRNQISCGTACFYRYPSGTVMTLTATVASPASTFVGWGGPCSGTASTCVVTMSKDQTVTATFGLAGNAYPLTVTRTGSGAGTITSSPAGIACGSACTANFASGTAVTLTATATAPSVFGGWSGPCTGTSAICVVTVTQATSVTANFVAGQDTSLLVNVGGTGSGHVFADVGGISCPATCSAIIPAGTAVTLTASAVDGSTFKGWGGACSGTATTCVVTTGTSGLTVNATFDLGGTTVYAFTVSKSGSGSGTVTSTPSGIDCGSLCAASFTANSVVTLTATATPPSVFAGWGGSGTNYCAGTDPVCILTLSQAGSTTAFFMAPEDLAFYVTVGGIGSGRVTSDVGGISCPGTCSALLPPGTPVTLTATPASGSTFTGWSGACTGAASTCVITTGTYGLQANATFGLPGLLPLSVALSGPGTGKITSTPAGIDCTTSCSVGFPAGTMVTLTATPVNGTGYLSMFSGWSGACSGTALTCTVTMNQAQTVTATFSAARPLYTVTVTKAGTGTGTVSGSGPGGAISCGTTCQTSIALDGAITLTAAAAAGSTFSGWSGDCTGTAATCALTITRATAVTATFDAPKTGGCKVTYSVTNEWSGGFGASLVIQNTGTTAWTSWTVTWTYPNASQKITQIWNATVSQSGQAVTVKNLSYNGSIPAGGSYSSAGFNGTWSGSNPAPAQFSVNGIVCN